MNPLYNTQPPPLLHCSCTHTRDNIGPAGGTAVGEALAAVSSLTSLHVGYRDPLPHTLPSPDLHPLKSHGVITAACRIQDLGNAFWLLVSALLPSTAAITVYPARVGVKAFGSGNEYWAFLATLKPGTRLVSVSGGEGDGDIGSYSYSHSNESCYVQWDADGGTRLTYFRDVELLVRACVPNVLRSRGALPITLSKKLSQTIAQMKACQPVYRRAVTAVSHVDID